MTDKPIRIGCHRQGAASPRAGDRGVERWQARLLRTLAGMREYWMFSAVFRHE